MCYSSNSNASIWIFAYRHILLIRALIEQQADRQATKMALMQVVIVVISMIPGGIYNIYRLITANVSKDINRQMLENFVSTITVLISYFYYTVCIFFIQLIKMYIL